MFKPLIASVTLAVTLAADWNACKYWSHKYATELEKAIVAHESGIDASLYEELMRQYGVQVLVECKGYYSEETLDQVKRTIKEKQ